MGVDWHDPDQSQWAARYGNNYQQADSALVALTGTAVWHDGANGLTTTPAGPLPTIALTKDMDLSAYGLIDGHAYTVLGVTGGPGGTKVVLRNPWGSDGPVQQGANDGIVTISGDVFGRVMQGFAVA
jgi:hypothetical protein